MREASQDEGNGGGPDNDEADGEPQHRVTNAVAVGLALFVLKKMRVAHFIVRLDWWFLGVGTRRGFH